MVRKGEIHHVVPKPAGGWEVRKSGSKRASVHTQTKAEAVKRARVISRNQGTGLLIHDKDGKIHRNDHRVRDSR